MDAITLATDLAGETRCALHIVHVSSPEGLALISAARTAGVDVTAETCPHYLLLNDKDVERIGPLAKCAPPLRDEMRRLELWEALRRGLVHTLGTDHSPAPMDMKTSTNFFKVWGGVAGCQHGFPLTIAAGLLDHGLMPDMLSAMLSSNVADRFGIGSRKGRIAVGQEADFVFLELASGNESSPRVRINVGDLLTRHQLSAYLGMENRCRIQRTLCRGQVVWPLNPNGTSPRGRWIRPDDHISQASRN